MKDVTELSPEELLLAYVGSFRSLIAAENTRDVGWDEYHRLSVECVSLEEEILRRLRK